MEPFLSASKQRNYGKGWSASILQEQLAPNELRTTRGHAMEALNSEEKRHHHAAPTEGQPVNELPEKRKKWEKTDIFTSD